MTPAQILADPEIVRLQRDLIEATLKADDSGEFMDLGERDRISLELDARIRMVAKENHVQD